MQKDDDDLDDLLDEALNDFEREESKPTPVAAVASSPSAVVPGDVDEMKRDIEETLGKMQLPPEMDEFRQALLSSFQSMASLAEQTPNANSAPLPEGDGGDSVMMEAFLKDVLGKDVL